MQINHRPIGNNHPPYIIAEMSANHNGSLKTEFCEVKMALAVLRFMFLMDWALRLIAARATYFLCFAKV